MREPTACLSGMIRYRNKKRALNALKNMRKRSTHIITACRADECTFCGGWHLTSKPENWRMKLMRRLNGG